MITRFYKKQTSRESLEFIADIANNFVHKVYRACLPIHKNKTISHRILTETLSLFLSEYMMIEVSETNYLKLTDSKTSEYAPEFGPIESKQLSIAAEVLIEHLVSKSMARIEKGPLSPNDVVDAIKSDEELYSVYQKIQE